MPGWQHERRSRHARGYGTAWGKARAVALARDLHLCQPCQREGRVTPAAEVDHITPKAKGGTDDLDNLQAICRSCHEAKTARDAAEAQGRTVKPATAFGPDGRPVWPDGRG